MTDSVGVTGQGGNFRVIRGALTVVALSVGVSACGPPTPPPAPAPLEAPPISAEGLILTDIDLADLLPPPPPAEGRELSDPILLSPATRFADLEQRVNYWILRWQVWEEGTFNTYLDRMTWYQDLVDVELEERGLPVSLRYLPLIESGYNTRAVSRVGAAGLWQFMPATARFLGMDVTPLIDERRDPWRSTDLALDYLIELSDRFEGSWFLALASYNAGWGRVQRILDRYAPGQAPTDSLYWVMKDRFPAETRDFVPKLLAASRVARDPALYGFEPPENSDDRGLEMVEVPDATSLDVIARAADVELDEIERLNAHLIRGYTPPDRVTGVRVPLGAGATFERVFPTIPVDERVSFVEHRIASGETLSHVADRYRLPLSELRAANPGLDPRRLQIGQWIVVPRSPTTDLASSGRIRRVGQSGGTGATASSGSNGSATTASGEITSFAYRVTSGESLWLIARRHGVTVNELREWNDLDPDETLHPGDQLQIRGVRVALYRVRPGDTISEIALRHGVRTDALLRANGLGSGSVIRPGDEVRIPGPETE